MSQKAHDDSIVIWQNYRFTVLTSRLIRLEYTVDQNFEDRPTQIVVNRSFKPVDFQLKNGNETLEIITADVHLIFHKETGGFTKHNLRIEPIGNFSTYHSVWHFDEPIATLKGTARTLDRVDGAVPLSEGLMNKRGYSVINDSDSMVMTADGWIEARQKGIQDYYYFGYGRDYLGTLKDYYQLAGATPLIPRYTLGNWWSRYYAYSAEEYKKLMRRFENEDLPFSVAVIDMDWHLIDIPSQYGSGWTGYTWNRDLFPDPEEFIDWLHKRGMKVSLNIHPANGVMPHEEMYEAMAAELDVNASKKEPINFDVSDPKFMEAYFKFLHHPNEAIGVDFWWIDWQSGGISSVNGLDPLWMLNHYHFQDIARTGQRPLIFSRYAGLGSHRYPLGFSGDTVISWESLDFQPYFTATASNVGYTWWSHDIGGHMQGYKNDELYVRWNQLGVFSPINRLHNTKGEFYSKEPWRFSNDAERITGDYLRLRHRLVPYLYTMNYLTHQDGLPLVQPMYYQHPWENSAYEVPNQYYFGTQLLVAPITSKINPITKRAAVTAWLPKGKWIDFFTGQTYIGNRKITLYRKLDDIPVLAKAGAIIPLASDAKMANPAELDLYIFPGADGSFTLFEDNGEEARAFTKFEWYWETRSFTIHPVEGDSSVVPEKRIYKLHLAGADEVVTVDVAGVFQLDDLELKSEPINEKVFHFLDQAQIAFGTKNRIMEIVRKNNGNITILHELQAMDLPEAVIGVLSEILWAE